jgi:hypothetical protein
MCVQFAVKTPVSSEVVPINIQPEETELEQQLRVKVESLRARILELEDEAHTTARDDSHSMDNSMEIEVQCASDANGKNDTIAYAIPVDLDEKSHVDDKVGQLESKKRKKHKAKKKRNSRKE